MRTFFFALFAAILRFVLSLRYRVKVKGADVLEKIQSEQTKGILFLPNHPALIDPVIVFSQISFLAPRPLADERQMSGFARKLVAYLLHAVTMPDIRRDGKKGKKAVQKAIASLAESLLHGDNILLYPSGRLYRSSQEAIGANSAVTQLLEASPETKVVLIRTTGLWGSSFSYAKGAEPFLVPAALRGLFILLMNFIFLTPRRDVVLEFYSPDDLPVMSGRMAVNRYLEEFYNEQAYPAFTMPYFFWQKKEPSFLPEVQETKAQRSPVFVSADTKKKVIALLKEYASLDEESAITAEKRLAGDLGIDSLSLVELATSLEETFGFPVVQMDKLVTVHDCFLAAEGEFGFCDESEKEQPLPRAWRQLLQEKDGEDGLGVATRSQNFVQSFLEITAKNPFRAFLAEKSGVKTRIAVLTGAVILAREIQKLSGKRVGIMLPATSAAFVAWIACLLAGKEPVMYNWTSGKANMRHGIALTNTEWIITASALQNILARQGNDLQELPVSWFWLEPFAEKLTIKEKLRGGITAFLHVFGIKNVSSSQVPATAAILFTSGSEAAPKAVPLTHQNIMANAQDVLSVIGTMKKDILLAMLPPFHSFGLLVGLALPAATGLATVYYPNPTEAVNISSHIRRFSVSILAATPTFLESILGQTEDLSRFSSVRFAFVGAEKCPDRLFDTFSVKCPGAILCEGYGITECSPVVAANLPTKTIRGTIGVAMPSVVTAIVDADCMYESGEIRPVTVGEKGILLVRGPSVFHGYLGDAPNPFVEFDGDVWYNTEDFVTSDASGHMAFAGRRKRFIKIAGEMISLPQMEDVLQKALADRADLPDDGIPYVAIEARSEGDGSKLPKIIAFTPLSVTASELNRHCKDAGLSPLYSVEKVITLKMIPLLGSGKIDYQALKRMFV